MNFRQQFRRRLKYYLNSPKLGVWLTVLVAAVYAAHILLIMAYPEGPGAPFDFNIDWLASMAMARGYGPYASYFHPAALAQLAHQYQMERFIGAYYYPPLTAQLVMPLTLLPFRLAGYVWLVILTAAFIASAWMLGKSTTLPYGVTLAVAMVMNFWPVYITLVAGQVNGLMLLALCWAFYCGSRNRQAGLGISVALAAMLKIVPLAHLAYLGWTSRWKAFIAGLVTMGLLFVSAVPIIGWQGLVQFFRIFIQKGASPLLDRGLVNDSLAGAIGFLIGPGETSRIVWLGVAGVVAGLTAAACWGKGSRPKVFEVEFSVVTLAANLVTPYAFYQQFALMVIPLFMVTKLILEQPGQRWRLWLIVAAYSLINLSTYFPVWFLAFSPTYVSLLLWGGMVIWLIRQKLTFTSQGVSPKAPATDAA